VPEVAVLVKFRFFKVIPLVELVATFKTPTLLVLIFATMLTWFCATELAVGPTTVTACVPLIAMVSE
jgi:hypothetical protein